MYSAFYWLFSTFSCYHILFSNAIAFFFSHFFQYLNLVLPILYTVFVKNYHAQPLNSAKETFFVYFSQNVSFSIWFQNDFYVICALTAVLVEYVMSDDRSFQSVDHSSEIETAVCDVPVKHLLCRLHTGIIDSCSRRSAYRPLATGENCPL